MYKSNKKFIPFTKANYPQGYSREDCEKELETTVAEIDLLKRKLTVLEANAKLLKFHLELGGYYKERHEEWKH